MKKIILILLVLPLLFIAHRTHAVVNWTRDSIKAVCIEAISEHESSAVASVSGTSVNLDNRITAVENKMSYLEQTLNSLSSVLTQLFGLLVKLIK